MVEGLQALLHDITDLKATPDADLEFLINLETTILQKMREPVQQMMGQELGGPMGGPTPPMMPPGGASPMGPGAGVPGVMSGRGMPNPDELRRLIGNGAEAR